MEALLVLYDYFLILFRLGGGGLPVLSLYINNYFKIEASATKVVYLL